MSRFFETWPFLTVCIGGHMSADFFESNENHYILSAGQVACLCYNCEYIGKGRMHDYG